MNPTDEQMIRQRLHKHLAALPVRPAPVPAIASRGRSIRARRRGIAATCLTATAGVAAALVAVPSLLPGGTHGGRVVTINTPDQRAPGGVFASGTANGRSWQLSVRNIAGAGGWCIPTVMLNGRDGDVLFAPGYPSSALLSTMFAAPHQIPGQIRGKPGVGFGFAQVGQDVTRVDGTVSGGKPFSARPVSVAQCGQPYRLAGFAYQGSRVTRLRAISGHGHSYALPLPSSRTAGNLSPGTWANAGPHHPPAGPWTIGSGPVNGASWRVTESLTPGGDCYSAHVTRGSASSSSSQECVPIAAPPVGMTGIKLAISALPNASGTRGFTAYAALLSPRTATVTVKLADGTRHIFQPIPVSGRRYVGFVLPSADTLAWLTLSGANGRVFASYATIPDAQPGGGTIAQSGSSSASAPPQVSASPGKSSR